MSNSLKGILRFSAAIIVFAAGPLTGWVDPSFVESSFKSALETYRKANYNQAHESFTTLLMDSRGTGYYSMTRFMVALSSYREGRWEPAAREFADFVKSFPESEFASTAKLYQGNALFFSGDLVGAAEAFLASAKTAGVTNPEVHTNAMTSAANLLWGYLTDDQMALLSGRIEGVSGQIVDFYRVKRFQHRGENRRALELCNRSLESRGTGEFTDSLRALSNSLSSSISGKITILVLAPTEGRYAEFGLAIANGVRMAVEKNSRDGKKNISIVVENTSADPLVATYACKSAIAKHAPIAVIGPLLSEVAVPVAICCDQERVPLIMPTASKEGLAGISPFTFQLSAPPSVGAKTLARFAVDSLGLTRFSALAPDDAVGRKAVDTFAKEVEALGAKMSGVAYYSSGTIDFSEQLKSIRKPYWEEARRSFPYADSTDSRFYKPDRSVRNEDEWIVEIPGFFIPAYSEDLVNILPQVPFNYIRARFLGENGWIINQLKTMNGALLDSSIIVPDDFWVDESSTMWTAFSNEYRKSFGAAPTRIAALAYDCAKLVLTGIDKGLITPEQQRDFLSATRNFVGPSGKITFDEFGTNVDVSLVRFNGNKPEKIR